MSRYILRFVGQGPCPPTDLETLRTSEDLKILDESDAGKKDRSARCASQNSPPVFRVANRLHSSQRPTLERGDNVSKSKPHVRPWGLLFVIH